MQEQRQRGRGTPRALQSHEMSSELNRQRDLVFTVGTCLLLAVAIFLLWQEHVASTFGVLPYALLLLCPFIYLFMHRTLRDRGSAGDEATQIRRFKEGR